MFGLLGSLFGGGGGGALAGCGLCGLLGSVNGLLGTLGGAAGLFNHLQMSNARTQLMKKLGQEYDDKRLASRTGVGQMSGEAPRTGSLPGLDELMANAQGSTQP